MNLLTVVIVVYAIFLVNSEQMKTPTVKVIDKSHYDECDILFFSTMRKWTELTTDLLSIKKKLYLNYNVLSGTWNYVSKVASLFEGENLLDKEKMVSKSSALSSPFTVSTIPSNKNLNGKFLPKKIKKVNNDSQHADLDYSSIKNPKKAFLGLIEDEPHTGHTFLKATYWRSMWKNVTNWHSVYLQNVLKKLSNIQNAYQKKQRSKLEEHLKVSGSFAKSIADTILLGHNAALTLIKTELELYSNGTLKNILKCLSNTKFATHLKILSAGQVFFNDHLQGLFHSAHLKYTRLVLFFLHMGFEESREKLYVKHTSQCNLNEILALLQEDELWKASISIELQLQDAELRMRLSGNLLISLIDDCTNRFGALKSDHHGKNFLHEILLKGEQKVMNSRPVVWFKRQKN